MDLLESFVRLELRDMQLSQVEATRASESSASSFSRAAWGHHHLRQRIKRNEEVMGKEALRVTGLEDRFLKQVRGL